MRLLVIGGAGYIGSRLVPALLERNHDVLVVDTFWFGNHLPVGTDFQESDASKIFDEHLKWADCVIWLAGLSNDPMAEFSPSRNFVDNAALPALLAYRSRRAGVKRFIHAGSCSIYGHASDYAQDESGVPTAVFPYGVAKLMAETGCWQQACSEMSVIMLRKGTVSGYSPRMRFDLIVNTMFKDAMTKGEITVNNPDIWRPILSIDDAVTAYIKAIEAPKFLSGVFNIVSENATIGDVGSRVAYALAELDGNKHTIIHTKQIPDIRNYKVSGAKAERALTFRPRGLVETIVESLWERRHDFGDYTDERFYNIRVFEGLLARHNP